MHPTYGFPQAQSNSHHLQGPSHHTQGPTDLTGRIRLAADEYFAVGGFSSVWPGVWHSSNGPSDGQLALKTFHGSRLPHNAEKEKFLKRVRRETLNWHRLRHINVLPLLGICYERIAGIPDFPILVSPYCKFGNIVGFLRRYPNANRLPLIHQAADGLSYLHSNRFVHGDIKGSNILINDHQQAVLCDFGRTKLLDDDDYSKTLLASAQWTAPELLLAPEGEAIPISFASDVWAFAMVIVEIFTGGKPWPCTDHVVLQKVMSNMRPERRWYPLIPDNIWRILVRCWAFNPQERPSIADLKTWL